MVATSAEIAEPDRPITTIAAISGAEFPCHARSYEVDDRIHRAELAQFGTRLKGHDHPGGAGHEAQHRKGPGSDFGHLLHGASPAKASAGKRIDAHGKPQAVPELNRQAADVLYLADRRTANGSKKTHGLLIARPVQAPSASDSEEWTSKTSSRRVSCST